MDEMNHIDLPMTEDSKLVLFGSAKSVVPVVYDPTRDIIILQLVKNWKTIAKV